VSEEEDWFEYADRAGRSVRVSGAQHYDPVTQVKTETAYRRWIDEGREVTQVAPLRLRYFLPQETATLLCDNGFGVVERYGDASFNELNDDSPHMIFVCRRASGA
jgi:hypothetical protein